MSSRVCVIGASMCAPVYALIRLTLSMLAALSHIGLLKYVKRNILYVYIYVYTHI